MALQPRQLVRAAAMIIAFVLITAGLARQNFGAVGMGVVVILAALLDLKNRQLAQAFLVLIVAGLATQKYGAAVVGAAVIVAVLIDRTKHKQV